MSSEVIRYRQVETLGEAAERLVVDRQPLGATQEGLLVIVWRRRWTVVICVLLCLGAALTYLLVKTPVYTSTARVHVQEMGPRILTAESQGTRQDESYLYAQAEFLRASPIVEPVVQRPEIRRLACLQGVSNPLGFVKSRLVITVGRQDHIINVAFDAPRPEEAAALVNAIIKSYIEYNNGQNRATSTELLEVLREVKEKRDAELAEKSRAVYEYKVANGTLSFESDHGNIVMQRLAKLSDALTDAELMTTTAKANFDAAVAVGLSPQKMRRLLEAENIAGRTLPGESEIEERETRAELSRVETQLALVRERYGKGHPTLAALETVISQRRARLEALDKEYCEAYVEAARQAWRTAMAKASEIRAQMEDQQKLARDLNAKAAEYQRLEAERSRVSRLCDALDSRIKELNVAEQVGALNIRILEPAQVEETPARPKWGMVLALGLAAGMMLGVGSSLVREMRDERVQSAEELSEGLGLPVLGQIPRIRSRRTSVEVAQLVHRQPMSEGAEAYRTLRTAVYFGACAGKARTLLITSPGPGEGKSTTASNLAIAMAQTGRRVLLMDADFRRPQQHLIFGLEGKDGLANVLKGEVAVEEVIEGTEIGNLEVLPCGAIPENPAEMLSGAAFGSLLAILRERYDTVVIDSPPAGAVTDAPILSTQVDASVLVVRVGVSSRHGVADAMDCLKGVGARVVGAVANDVVSRSRHRYYGRNGEYGGGVMLEDRTARTRSLADDRTDDWRADGVGAGKESMRR